MLIRGNESWDRGRGRVRGLTCGRVCRCLVWCLGRCHKRLVSNNHLALTKTELAQLVFASNFRDTNENSWQARSRRKGPN